MASQLEELAKAVKNWADGETYEDLEQALAPFLDKVLASDSDRNLWALIIMSGVVFEGDLWGRYLQATIPLSRRQAFYSEFQGCKESDARRDLRDALFGPAEMAA